MSQIKDTHNEHHYWRYDTECFKTISADHFLADYWQANNAITGKESGRGTTLFVRHQQHELVLRHYLRGGMMSHISHDQYLFRDLEKTRAFAEFTILARLSEQGFAVPKPAAAQVVRTGFTYRADLLTHKIPQAQDLLRVLQAPQPAEFYCQLGLFIAGFHQQGVFHADLNIQNILVDSQDKFWLIDFDRAQQRSPEKSWQQANLKRLKRSFEKEVLRHNIKWSESDWQLLTKAYQKEIRQ